MDRKEKIIAEFNITDINFREQFIDSYNNCLFCGTELDFIHNTDFIYQLVEEKASCPSCKIESINNNHALQ